MISFDFRIFFLRCRNQHLCFDKDQPSDRLYSLNARSESGGNSEKRFYSTPPVKTVAFLRQSYPSFLSRFRPCYSDSSQLFRFRNPSFKALRQILVRQLPFVVKNFEFPIAHPIYQSHFCYTFLRFSDALPPPLTLPFFGGILQVKGFT